MIHASKYQPRIFPLGGSGSPAEIDRAQSIDPTTTTNREKINEIGRTDAVGFVKKPSSVAYSMTQFEYGSFEFWRKITNKSDATTTITLDDFKTPAFDICAFLTDDNGTFRGTLLYPNLRTSGFSLNIGDPDATMERSFDLVGEKAITWQGANKYYIEVEHTAGSAIDDDISLAARVPAIDPDIDVSESDAKKYIFRVTRTRSGVTTVLVETTDYTYNTGTTTLTIVSPLASDHYKVFYTSATAPATLFTENNVDVPALSADCVSIFLYIPGSGSPSDSDYLYRLQSVNIEASFEREDLKEIGNKEVVQRGVNSKTVTVTLGRILEEFTMEEVLRGEVAGYGKIDADEFTDDAALIVKVYEDSSKTTLKYGFLATGLTPSDLGNGAAVNSYVNADTTLTGEALTISTDNAQLGNF